MPSLPVFERLLHSVLLCTSSKFADFLKSKATLETEMKTSSLPVLFPETVNWHDWCFGASRWYTNRWSFRETARGLSCLNGYFVFRESVEIRHKEAWVIHHDCTWFGALEGRYRQMPRNLVWHVTGTLRIFLCGAQFDPSSASGEHFSVSVSSFLPKGAEYLPANNSKI